MLIGSQLICDLSNGTIFNDLEQPKIAQATLICKLCAVFPVFETDQ